MRAGMVQGMPWEMERQQNDMARQGKRLIWIDIDKENGVTWAITEDY